jgi:Histidine kinase-, DNA gyrase B-, and HSP90-like ATPase
MKSKTIHTIIGAIVLIVLVVVWKLNSYYKQEKSAFVEGQIHQQSITLKTSIASQIAQLKNIISSYQGQVDESKVNWVQINPFFALAQLEISASGAYTVKNLFVKSGAPASNWSKDYLQKAFSYSAFSNKDIHVQLFQNQGGEKFLSLIFADQRIQNTRLAVALVGDASYFQKYFDTVRSAKSTNLVMTSDSVVVGHTQSDYIATKSLESKLSASKYYIDRDEIRSSNLFIMSYAPKLAKNEFLAIPLFVLIFIFGFAFLIIGISMYALKPIENEERKAEIFRKVFEEVQNPKPSSMPPVASAPIKKSFVVPEPSVDESDFRLEDYSAAAEIEQLLDEDIPEIPLQERVERELIREKQASLPSIFDTIGKKNIAMGDVVELALRHLSNEITISGVEIHKSYESKKQYECDVDRFRKSIENLIMNSIEAKAKNITIKVYDDPNESKHPVNIDIIDDGCGVEPGTTDKIWQPFYGTKDKLKHKGLGLSEALSVVRRYAADVRVIENAGTGVTLRIEMDAELRRLHQGSRAGEASSEIDSHGSTATGFAVEASRAEIDIDAILDLRDEDESVETPLAAQIEKEFTTTQFKMDEKVNVVTNPEIKVDKPTKPIDNFAIKVRKPGRT